MAGIWKWYRSLRLRWQVAIAIVLVIFLLGLFGGSAPRTDATTTAAEVTTSAAASASSSPGTTASAASSGAPFATSVMSAAATSKCVSRGGLPDPACTPGAIDPAVTQANIATTICKSGYTETVRPPTSYTNPLKLQSMAAYGATGAPSDYEFDHLISLELGGNPRDLANLWPEPYGGEFNARQKDQIENKLHDLICSGAISLADAQQSIATDWKAAWERYVGGKAPSSPVATGTVAATAAAGGPTFASCAAARAAGYTTPLYRGQPGYSSRLDGDGDGIACE